MTSKFHRTKPYIRCVLIFILWSLLFGISYAQSPLYTSNQNQYFLHGFSLAGEGYLANDWLANTRDSTPVFSALVVFTVKYLRSDFFFYLYYVLLMGVYLFSLLGITHIVLSEKVWLDSSKRFVWVTGKRNNEERESNNYLLILLALFFLVHSAGLRYAFSRFLGSNWIYLLEDGVADQRMLGPVLQPSSFGVFLALSVYFFLRKKPYLAVFSAALAATLHPTYLLTAGLLIVSYIYVLWRVEKQFMMSLKVGLVALITVMPVLIYSVIMFTPTSQEIANQAAEILINIRIPHHALVSQWLDATVFLKLGFLLCAIYLVRGTRLYWILILTGLLAGILTVIQILSNSSTLALLFPWRISILLVPVAVTIILARLSVLLNTKFTGASVSRLKELLALGVILICVWVGGVRFWLDLGRKQNAPEQMLFRYVHSHLLKGDAYLIPVKLQDFRLETGAPAFVDFKSIPYKDTEILEWYSRLQIADSFYRQPGCTWLPQLTAEGINHIILDQADGLEQCPGLQLQYQDSIYQIYSWQVPYKP